MSDSIFTALPALQTPCHSYLRKLSQPGLNQACMYILPLHDHDGYVSHYVSYSPNKYDDIAREQAISQYKLRVHKQEVMKFG